MVVGDKGVGLKVTHIDLSMTNFAVMHNSIPVERCAIHSMKEQSPPEVVALSAKHEVMFLPSPGQ